MVKTGNHKVKLEQGRVAVSPPMELFYVAIYNELRLL